MKFFQQRACRIAGLTSLLALLLLQALPGQTQANEPLGVGQKAPDLTLRNLEGKEISLSKIWKDSPLVLIVLRGFPGYQCPACQAQVGQFKRDAADLEKKGCRVVFVYPGVKASLEQRAKEFAGEEKLPAIFSFAIDPDYALTNAYGIRWDAPNETAYPSTFVINSKGVVTWSRISRTHGGRVSVKEVLTALGEVK